MLNKIIQREYLTTDHATSRVIALSPSFCSECLSNRNVAVLKTFEICSTFLTFSNN